MKTLEIKVIVDKELEQKIGQWFEELTWVWNEAIKLLLEYHQVTYYDTFLAKRATSEGFSLEGIERVRLTFKKHTAWSATCPIAYIKDGNYMQISKEEKGERKIVEPRLKGVSDKAIGGYLTKTRLNSMRAEQDLPPLQVHSDYIGGLFLQLATSWKAYCDVSNRNAHKPKMRGDKRAPSVSSLYANQPEGLKILGGANALKLPGISKIKVVGRRLEKRLSRLRLTSACSIRSASLKKEPSGYYVCLTVAHPLEVERKRLETELLKLRKSAKKLGQKLSAEEEESYKERIAAVEHALSADMKALHKIKPTNKIVGIDPGVVSLATTDDGRQYAPNRRFNKRQRRLKRLQRRASRQREKNKDKPTNASKKTDKLVALEWEKIRRSRSAYTHKLSTKLVREHDVIVIENTQLSNMTRAPKAKPSEDGNHYLPNGARAKAGLNRSIHNSCIGQLRSRIKEKADTFDRTYLTNQAQYSSLECHCCGEVGERPTQSEFYCRNSECDLVDQRQQADINAARNHLIGGVSSLLADRK